MSDDPGSEPERDEIVPQQDTDLGQRASLDRQTWAFEQLFEIERQRVDSNNRRTEVALKVIAASEASDERQFQYHVEKLRQGSQDRNERRRSALQLLWAFFAVAVAGVGLVFFMLFHWSCPDFVDT